MKWSELLPGDMMLVSGQNGTVDLEPFQWDVFLVLTVDWLSSRTVIMDAFVVSRGNAVLKRYNFEEREISNVFHVYRRGEDARGDQKQTRQDNASHRRTDRARRPRPVIR